MSKIEVDKIDPQSGTALEIGTSGDTITVPTGAGLTVTDEVKTNKISPATGTAFALGDSGDTFTVPSGATIVNSGTATGFGGDNTPNFFAYRSGSQDSISSETWTKVQLNAEEYDTASAFDSSSNYRFTVPAGQGGKYFFQASIFGNAGDNNLQRLHIRLYKNGSTILTISENDWTNQAYRNSQMYSASGVLDLSATDYIELFVKAWIGSGTLSVNPGGGANESPSRLIGYKIIE